MSNKLLDAATSTGAGAKFNVTSDNGSTHSVQVGMGGTLVATAVTVDLEGSLDGLKWFQLAQHILTAGEITAESALFHVVNTPVNFVRANLITLTGGTAPTVTVNHIVERRATS